LALKKAFSAGSGTGEHTLLSYW